MTQYSTIANGGGSKARRPGVLEIYAKPLDFVFSEMTTYLLW